METPIINKNPLPDNILLPLAITAHPRSCHFIRYAQKLLECPISPATYASRRIMESVYHQI